MLTEKEMRPVPNAEKKSRAFLRLAAVIAALRAPDGCPWDREQTPRSLAPSFLEEAYELIDALETGTPADVREETGDIFIHAVMQSHIKEEEGLYDVADVLNDVCDKLVRRHPHVFGDLKVSGTEEVLKNWDAIKQVEKRATRTSALDGVSPTMPALSQAEAYQRKAAKQGFDWPETAPVLEKVKEELRELEEAGRAGDQAHIEEELGDLLFAVVNLSRFLKADPEQALRGANRKFQRRFRHVEARMREQGRPMREAALKELDRYWDEAKALERAEKRD